MSRTLLRNGTRVRTLIVDDSVVIRRLVSHALEGTPEIEVVGWAANGTMALQKIAQLNPDIVTLDVEMPEMDGLETLRYIRKNHPQLLVIMFSTLTSRGATATMDALALGANDYVTKGSMVGSIDASIQALRGELIPKILQFFQIEGGGGSSSSIAERVARPVPAGTGGSQRSAGGLSGSASAVAVAEAPRPAGRPGVAFAGPRRILAIGVSTGGPTALAEIFPQFPANLSVPVVVVQHMPPMFTGLLAERLAHKSRIPVVEAREAMVVEAGKAYIAPGDYHLRLKRQGKDVICTLNQDPPENSCRPAVDVLFRSVQETYGGAALAVVLTGMGQDGLRGVEQMRGAGACVLAQDEASSVVWGMPGAVVKAGLADAVVNLQSAVPEIMKRLPA